MWTEFVVHEILFKMEGKSFRFNFGTIAGGALFNGCMLTICCRLFIENTVIDVVPLTNLIHATLFYIITILYNALHPTVKQLFVRSTRAFLLKCTF